MYRFALILLSGVSFAWCQATYQTDSLIVRAILDSNGLRNVRVEDVTMAEDGRIVVFEARRLGITRLPSIIGNLDALGYLNLSNNLLTNLPAAIGRLRRLVGIDVSDNRISTLPSEIGNLDSLLRLVVAMNRISAFPGSMGKLKNLESLHANDNAFSSFPFVVCSLTKLKQLVFSSNHIPSVPDSIGNLVSLEVLDFQGNQLSQLPAGIANLRKLKQLFLGSNRLTSLPSAMTGLALDTSRTGRTRYPLDVDTNKLCSLSVDLQQWVDIYEYNSNWRQSQECSNTPTGGAPHGGCGAGTGLAMFLPLFSIGVYKCMQRKQIDL
jgi:Leucine-rich repeat (LRR) protein